MQRILRAVSSNYKKQAAFQPFLTTTSIPRTYILLASLNHRMDPVRAAHSRRAGGRRL
jgi:hypothetical protein